MKLIDDYDFNRIFEYLVGLEEFLKTTKGYMICCFVVYCIKSCKYKDRKVIYHGK